MNLYVVASTEGPNFYCKASNQDEALKKFFKGIRDKSKFLDATARICTMELLMQLTPDEFFICENTDF